MTSPPKEMKSNPYKVPTGYFDELRGSIKERARAADAQAVTQAESRPTIRVQMRSAVIYVASFAAMVVMAITGYYFTGYQSQERELAQSFDEMSLIYGIDEDDIVDYTTPRTEIEQGLVAEASIEYFDAFGYPTSDYEF